MDISSKWTIDELMALPDFCFGNRYCITAFKGNGAPGTHVWAISELKLPVQCCVWQLVIMSMPETGGRGNLRIGLADSVPTSEAEMDAAYEIFPGLGNAHIGPNIIAMKAAVYAQLSLDVRKGIATGGKYLVIENECIIAYQRVLVVLLVSELPTNISGFLAHQFLTEVR